MDRLELGVGLTWFPAWEDRFDSLSDAIDVIEVEPQTLCWQTDDPEEPFVLDESALMRLQALPQAKLVHGVSSPVGTSEIPNPAGVRLLAQAAAGLEAELSSEHLSFNRTRRDGGMSFAGFLLPPRQSSAGVNQAVRGARSIARRLGMRSFSVETGVNYLRPRRDELRDGEFVGRVATRADCGILLDLHNVWTNELNGRQRVIEFLDDLPLERVWEVHVAGGFEFGGYWLDAHSGLVPEPLLDIAEWALPRLPELRAVIFEVLPEYVPALDVIAVRDQLERLRAIARRRPAPRKRAPRDLTSGGLRARRTEPDDSGPSPQAWENTLGDLAAGQIPAVEIQSLAEDPAVPMLQTLVKAARAGRITDGLRLTIRAVLLTQGAGGVEALLDRYMAATRPQLWGSAEASQFAGWLETQNVDRLVRDVATLEAAAIASLRGHRTIEVLASVEPRSTLTALGDGRLPDPLVTGAFRVEITP